MDSKLDRDLYERHPKILALRHEPQSLCPMGKGLAIGNGWYHLVDALCAALQRETDRNAAPQAVAIQIKEKFGGLRFYVKKASECQRSMIEAAVRLSTHICESCGSPGGLVHIAPGGIATRCSRHAADEFVCDSKSVESRRKG